MKKVLLYPNQNRKKEIAIENEKELVKRTAVQEDLLKENKLSQKKCKCY